MNIKNYLLHNIPYGFEPSSRIMATLEGSYKSNGASCNFRCVEDDVEDIMEALRWAGLISQGQGAPTLDFSALRPYGSPISSGGAASGVISFARMFDEIVSGMRRPGKKNSVGVAYLDITHPEIMDRVVDGVFIPGWLNPAVDKEFKTVFRGVLVDPETWPQVPPEVKEALARAYDNYQVFICKYLRTPDGKVLWPNVCTEARLPHKGTCVLGAINLGALTAEELTEAFSDAACWMSEYYNEVALPIFRDRPDLFDADNPENRQIGNGVFGLANYLGRYGISYKEAATEIREAIAKNPCIHPIKKLYQAYHVAARRLKADGFVRAFTVQPTASTAYRCEDLSGFACAPEIQPPQATRRSDGCPVYVLKSELKGDQLCVLPPYIQTRDEVPYADYRDFSEAYQEMLNSTGLAHTLSHCYYGEAFGVKELDDFLSSPLYSLYYRLDPADLSAATQKFTTWDNAGDLEIEDDAEATTCFLAPSNDITQRKGYCATCDGA